jgi:UDP-GlcNAc:undecaprenyl-phosphate GlcNAc-1-phosphate transferase
VLDTLVVIVLRLHAGRSPFVADRRHFHHRLLSLGLDHYEVVIVIYAVQCLLLLLAWQLRFESDLLILASFIGFAAVFAGTFLLLERSGWRWRASGASSHRSLPARIRIWLFQTERLPRWSMRIAFVCISIYWFSVVAYAGPIPKDIGALSVLCLLPFLLTIWLPRSAVVKTWLLRSALYVAVMVSVYLDHGTIARSPIQRLDDWIFLPMLAMSVIIGIRFSRERRFQATPLDLLLIFGALALPNLPGLAAAPSNLGLSAVKLVVLCYAVEMIAAVGSRVRVALLVVAAAFYVLVAVRAFS